MKRLIYPLLTLILLSGCATTGASVQAVSSPTNKSTEIISNPTGASIEINGEYVGETPIIVEIRRSCNDWTGAEYCNVTINAIPKIKGQFTQTKYFAYNTKIPKRILFEMGLEPTAPKQQYDVNINK